MKQLVLVVFLVIGMSSLFAQMQFQAGLGIDFPGTQTIDGNGGDVDLDTNMGISPSFEVLYPVMPNLLVGGGLEFQLGRGLDETGADDVAFSFIPIYLSGKYAIPMDAAITPEILLHLGFDFFTGNDEYKGDDDLSGGLYFGLGAGISHPSGFTADLMYRVCNGGVEGDYNDDYYGNYSYDYDVAQKYLTLRLGYRF